MKPAPMSIQTTYPVFIRNTRIQVKMDETQIDILEPELYLKARIKFDYNIVSTSIYDGNDDVT